MSLAIAAAVPSDMSLEQRDRDQRFIRALDALLAQSGSTHTAHDLVELHAAPAQGRAVFAAEHVLDGVAHPPLEAPEQRERVP